MSSPDDPRSGHGAEDPFDRPPDESGTRADQTAPIQPGSFPGAYPGSAPAGDGPPEGYWERVAREQQQGQQQGPPAYGASPYAAGGTPPPPPPPPGYAHPGYQPQGYAPAGYPPAGYTGGYGYALAPSHPSATTALVLGLVGLIGGFLCGVGFVVSPFALFVGRKAMREIDASHGQLGGRSNAKAGFVLGIIGTVLLVLGVLAIAGLVVAGLAVNGSSSSTEF